MAKYELRALSVGEILDGAIALYRDYFGTLVSIAIVCQGIPTIMTVYVSLAGGNLEHLGLAMLAFALSAVGGLIATGATLWAISEAFLGGDPTTEGALGFAVGKAFRLLVAGAAKYILIVLGSFLFVIPGIIAACGYAVVAQAVVLEDQSATESLRRSWRLTKGFKGKAFVLGVVVWILLYLPFVAGIGLATFMPGIESFVDVGAQLLWLVVYPIVPCAFTLFYYDLRVRQEAFDLEHLSTQLGLEPARA